MSRGEDIRTLLREHYRRLQKLKEAEAKQGINTSPEVLTEIEDIEAKIECLQAELNHINHSPEPKQPDSPPVSEESNHAPRPTGLFSVEKPLTPSAKKTGRSKLMDNNIKQGSGVIISGVQGNIIGGTFVGRDKKIINIGQMPAASEYQPTYAEFQQLIEGIHRELTELTAHTSALSQISSGTPSRMQGTADDFGAMAEQVVANSGFGALAVEEIRDTLGNTATELSRLIKKSKNIVVQSDWQGVVVEPLIEKLELLVKQTLQAELMLKDH